MVSNTSMPFPPNVVDDESCHAVDVQPDHDHRSCDNDVVAVEDYLHESPRSGFIRAEWRFRCGEDLATIELVPRPESINAPDEHETLGLLVGTRSPDLDVELWQDVGVPDSVGRVVNLEYPRVARAAVVVSEIRMSKRRTRLTVHDALSTMEVGFREFQEWRVPCGRTRRRNASVH